MSKKNRLERKREREAQKLLRKIQTQKQKETEKYSCSLANVLSESNGYVSDDEKALR